MTVNISAAAGEQAVVALAKNQGEPTWLQELRVAAFKSFVEAEHPDWDRRTRLDAVDFSSIVPYTAAPAVHSVDALPAAVQELLAGADDDAAIVVQVNSSVVYKQLPASLAEQGVVVSSLDEAVRTHEELVKEHLMSQIAPDTDKLTALHTALHAGGLFVYVPADVQAALPVEFLVWSDNDNLGMFPHVLVVADQGAEVTVVERFVSGEEAHIVSQITEVIAKPNARVTLGSVQGWGDGTQSFHVRRASIARDAKVDWVLGELGSKLGRAATHSALEGDGSESTASMVFFVDQEQHIDCGLTMNHIGSYTNSDMLTKGVLKDKGRAIYRAITDIEDGAVNTTGFQIENTLMLSSDARIDAIPELEIEETEVQAGHAATVAQVDDVQLFYLMSRGISRTDSINLIVQGFIDPLLSRIPLDDVRQDIESLVARKLAR